MSLPVLHYLVPLEFHTPHRKCSMGNIGRVAVGEDGTCQEICPILKVGIVPKCSFILPLYSLEK